MPDNPFVALCEVASENNWCWKLNCTTCGHQDFLIGLSQIAQNRHPSDARWLPPEVVRNADQRLVERLVDPRRSIAMGREKLYLACSSARIFDIANLSKFPDFLGYLGLALHYQEAVEVKYGLLTRLWGSDLLGMVSRSSQSEAMLQDLLGSDLSRLRWQDLEQVETDFDRGPMFDTNWIVT
ncbi:MAG: hypothetical protein ACR2IH_09760 [Pyrinomonadaceae bacterium]